MIRIMESKLNEIVEGWRSDEPGISSENIDYLIKQAEHFIQSEGALIRTEQSADKEIERLRKENERCVEALRYIAVTELVVMDDMWHVDKFRDKAISALDGNGNDE